MYLCVDNHIGKRWAMKLILPEGENKELFTSEIATLKSLDYYMFPRITDAFSVEDKVAIVTDFIEGETLEDYLKREGPLPIDKAIHYMEELTKGLLYLHGKSPGILYLDMKPSNIMILPNGEIRLFDFGIASSVLSKGKCYGSPGYAAPEQYEKDRILTKKTDVYALGMTVLSMVTGVVSKDIGRYRDYLNRTKLRRGTMRQNRSMCKNRQSMDFYELIFLCTNENEKDRPDTEEILSKIKCNMERHKRMMPIVILTAIILSFFIGGAYLIVQSSRQSEYEKYTRKMMDEISEYVVDGEYTYQGIRIICGYLDGHFLDEDTSEKYAYEVGRYYFESLRDYSTARHYFALINENRYPEVEYYLRLCKCMSQFGEGNEEIEHCLERLNIITETIQDDMRRENNLELIRFIKDELERTGG